MSLFYHIHPDHLIKCSERKNNIFTELNALELKGHTGSYLIGGQGGGVMSPQILVGK